MRGFFARLFGAKVRGTGPGMLHDPTLILARDWILANGGRITERDVDLIHGAMSDGTVVGYTCSPRRLRQLPDLTLLTPKSTGLDALCQDIADHAVAPELHITQIPASTDTLIRAAFARPYGDCQICASGAQVSAEGTVCGNCPLRQGRLVLVDADAVRQVVVERECERMSYEYTFEMRITAAHGRRDELIRIAVDSSSGESLEPLPDAMFEEASSAAPSAREGDPQEHVARAEEFMWPAVHAAACLARAQTLLDYQQKQEDLVATYEQLLIEAPETGRKVLQMREHALERLADTFAIDVETRLVAAATIHTREVEARMRLRDGSSVQAAVDLSRGLVSPRCAACGVAWSIGARCAEGHITCLSCQQRCAHCGRRRCSLCARPPFDVCGACAAVTCAACAHATARGHHKVRFTIPCLNGQSMNSATPSTLAANTFAEGGTAATGDDLRIGDLDAMTPATWRAFVVWLIAEMGCSIVRETRQDGNAPTFVCCADNASDYEMFVLGPGTVENDSLLFVFGHRPARPVAASLTHMEVAQMRAIARELPDARVVIVTTAKAPFGPPDGANARDYADAVDIIDRAQLERWLSDRPTKRRRAREEAAATADAQAVAASHLRTTVVQALSTIAERLSPTQAGPPAPELDQAHDLSDALPDQVTIARQSLAALETLIEQWEGAFAMKATRSGTQELAATDSEFNALTQRVEHLLSVLGDVSGAIAVPTALGMRGDWLEAVRRQLTEGCLALADRCQALDPTAWRSFDAVRDHTLAQASVEHLAAARRAGARARRLQDELDTRSPTSRNH